MNNSINSHSAEAIPKLQCSIKGQQEGVAGDEYPLSIEISVDPSANATALNTPVVKYISSILVRLEGPDTVTAVPLKDAGDNGLFSCDPKLTLCGLYDVSVCILCCTRVLIPAGGHQ